MEKDNKNQIFIKDCWLCSLYKVVIEEPEVKIVEKIRKAKDKDEEIIRVVKEMKKVGIKILQEEEWQIEGDLALKEEKVYMLKDKRLRTEIIQLHHNTPVAGYGRKWKMTELVTRNYQWLGVTRDMGKYIEDCDMCQRMKNKTDIPAGKLKLSKIPEKIWIYLIVDLNTKLSLVAGKDAILVVCNRLSKMIHFVAIIEGTLAEGLTRLFKDNIQKLHGLQFAAEMTKELNCMLEIETKLSTAFHPQTDGQIERKN